MTKDELIAQFNSENPEIIATINGEKITLDVAEYEKTRADWVAMRLDQIKLEFEVAATQSDKAALLEKLGISEDEAKLLLG
jgi:hypothetical protein